jgi:hypothetical protein
VLTLNKFYCRSSNAEIGVSEPHATEPNYRARVSEPNYKGRCAASKANFVGMRCPPSPKIKFVVKHLTNLKEKQSGIENKPTLLWRRRPREHRNEDEDLNRKGVNNTSFHLKDFVVLQGFYRGAPWATRSAQTREPLPYAPVAPLYAYTVGKPLGIRRVVCPT